MYPINNLLDLANYWYVAEKPPGFNVTDLMRDAPYHMIDIYILTVIICYLIYLPYFIKINLVKISFMGSASKKQIPKSFRANKDQDFFNG